jgi:gas vesicle protein
MSDVRHTGHNHVSRGSGFLVGLLCGAAVGAALGLLMARKSGAELRHQIAESANRLKRRAGDTYEGATHAVGNLVSRSRRALDVGRDAFQNGRRAGETPDA